MAVVLGLWKREEREDKKRERERGRGGSTAGTKENPG